MEKPRVSKTDRAAFARLAKASEVVCDEAPPRSISEVFDRLEAIRNALGRGSEPGLPPDEDAEIAELLRIRRRFLAGGRRGA